MKLPLIKIATVSSYWIYNSLIIIVVHFNIETLYIEHVFILTSKEFKKHFKNLVKEEIVGAQFNVIIDEDNEGLIIVQIQ